MNNEKEALKLLIEKEDKQGDPQKNLVEIEVQTQNIFDVGFSKKNFFNALEYCANTNLFIILTFRIIRTTMMNVRQQSIN